ncbi:MAG TPA: hypothetical protein PL061_13400, partial [Syntrophales bacterium]|nr:hypothetical protein [Syntrophales bacterium]
LFAHEYDVANSKEPSTCALVDLVVYSAAPYIVFIHENRCSTKSGLMLALANGEHPSLFVSASIFTHQNHLTTIVVMFASRV